jgi:hypothetical protein
VRGQPVGRTAVALVGAAIALAVIAVLKLAVYIATGAAP